MTYPNDELTRRRFIQSSAAITAAGVIPTSMSAVLGQDAVPTEKPGVRPVVISSANGVEEHDIGMGRLKPKSDVLDAVIAAVNVVEDDPEDDSVGLGGLPNEDGIVELDASVMHGPMHKAGAVAALRNIRNPSCVARLVMQRTDHVLLVGEGALRFAKAHGFKEEDLLTDASRKKWLKWKETLSKDDDWLSPDSGANEPQSRARFHNERIWGTINCCAVNAKGDIAGVTTTSGLAYKIPGRVGDSPIIGAGLYVDNAVGAAGSTGRGEANLQNCSSFAIVELMRNGKSPVDACLEALKRISDRTERRLRRADNNPDFNVSFYAVAKDGRYGSATMHSGGKFAVHDGTQARLEECAFLYRK